MADLYASITDDAVNRIINFLRFQAPYLFNYVAPSIKLQTDRQGKVVGFTDSWLACSPVLSPRPVFRATAEFHPCSCPVSR